MRSSRFDRRRFLQASGLGAASLPLLHADVEAACRTQGPRRFLMIVFPNGAPPNSFFPKTFGTGFDFPAAIKPFEPLRSRMIVFDGVKNQASVDQGGGGHVSFPALTTGVKPFKTTEVGHTAIGNAISIDQLIADGVATKVKLPRKSLYIGALNNDGSTGAITSYTGPQKAVTPDEDGYKLFDGLFAGAANSTGPDAAKELARLKLARKSVFDHVVGDLKRFRDRLGSEDRDKIDQHVTSVRDLEMQLSLEGSGADACGAKPQLVAGINFKDKNQLDKILPATLDIAVGALAADATRVVNLTIGDSWADMLPFPFLGADFVGTGMRGSPAGGGDDRAWHAHSHRNGDGHLKIVQWLFGRILTALNKMDSIKEGDRSLLDNTAVLLMSSQETGGSHNTARIPAILFGSCGGQFKTGRAMNMNGQAQNGLFAAIANAMGMDVPSFGAYPGLWALG